MLIRRRYAEKIEINLRDKDYLTYKIDNIEEHLEICDKVYIYNQMEEYVNEVNSLVEVIRKN